MKLTTQWSKEETHATSRRNQHRSPPRRISALSPQLNCLWDLLTDEQRQRALLTLSGIVLRQLDAPRDEEEVRDDHL